MRYVAIIQARMNSTRLPGKVLLDLCGQPVLYHIVKRVLQVKRIEKIVIATTNMEADDAIASFADREGITCFRGSADDVLARYYNAANSLKLKSEDAVIRITSDDPLIDPYVLEELLDYFENHNYSYATSTMAATGFPIGLGCEVFRFSALSEAFQHGRQHYEREHVTPYMYRDGKMFGKLVSPIDRSTWRFTLDTKEDYEFIKKVYAKLYHGVHNFYLQDIVDLLEREPELLRINQNIHQKSYME